MIKRRLEAIRSDRGAAAISIVFLMAAVILGGILTTAAISLAQTSSATKTYAAMNAAVDERLSVYAGDLAGNASPSTEAICYPSLATCVTVTGVEDTGTQRKLTLGAVFGDDGKDLTRIEILTVETGTHIAGFDAIGNPVWVTEQDGSTSYTGYRR